MGSRDILATSGAVLGVLATHFCSPRQPRLGDADLAMTCSRFAADALAALV